jgi:hypothetical protein
MNIINCEQGSQEWLAARCGLVTASMFKEVRAKLKNGDYSAKAKEYAFRLACERISGELLSEDKFETWEMRRGHELEPEARLEHESQYALLVERAGFAVSDCGLFGASVDGLIDDDGMSEYKCFVSPKSVMPIILNNDVGDIIDQAMGGMWITNRKWCHIGLYCPALKNIGLQLKVIEVARDESYISELKKDLIKFDEFITENVEMIKRSDKFYTIKTNQQRK